MKKVVDLYKRFIVELLWAWVGNPCTEKELDNLIQAQDHFVLFLAENLTDEARLDCILYNINFDQKWEVPRYGRGGGLVLYWKNSINLTIEDSHKYFFYAIINKNTNEEWRFVIFYGEPDTSRRHEAWSMLRSLNNWPNTPWICTGDFNKIKQ